MVTYPASASAPGEGQPLAWKLLKAPVPVRVLQAEVPVREQQENSVVQCRREGLGFLFRDSKRIQSSSPRTRMSLWQNLCSWEGL